MIKDLVSVLFTSYNKPKMVREAIESVLKQTYRNFELIILDDNSNSETLSVLSEYLKYPQVVFFKSNIKEEDRYKESPYARQINIGLKLTQGEFITYLCDDDLYLPERLEKMVKFLRENPQIKVCYGRQKWINLETGEEGIRQPDKILKDPGFKVDHNSVIHCKSCVDIVGDWDTKDLRAADAYFWNKLGSKFPFYPILEILDIHRYHRENLSAKIDRGEIKEIKWWNDF